MWISQWRKKISWKKYEYKAEGKKRKIQLQLKKYVAESTELSEKFALKKKDVNEVKLDY